MSVPRTPEPSRPERERPSTPPARGSRRRASAPRPDELPPESVEFLTAIDEFKRERMQRFLSLEEICLILAELGWRCRGGPPADHVRELETALDAYKREHERLFPSWSEVLDVFRSIGLERRLAG